MLDYVGKWMAYAIHRELIQANGARSNNSAVGRASGSLMSKLVSEGGDKNNATYIVQQS